MLQFVINKACVTVIITLLNIFTINHLQNFFIFGIIVTNDNGGQIGLPDLDNENMQAEE